MALSGKLQEKDENLCHNSNVVSQKEKKIEVHGFTTNLLEKREKCVF